MIKRLINIKLSTVACAVLATNALSTIDKKERLIDFINKTKSMNKC